LPVDRGGREEIYCSLSMAQNLPIFFTNIGKSFPLLSGTEFAAVKELTTHLFENTKKLVGVQAACNNETLTIHFDAFRGVNGNLCIVCGTEPLAQVLAGVAAAGQWRSDYDHMLGKAKYPIFGVHPNNLVPICGTCNRKAKGSKELLVVSGAANPPIRRLSFYPYQESCEGSVQVELVDDDTFLKLEVSWAGATPDEIVKINAWNEVYQVKSRVEGEFREFVTKIANDCRPRDCNDLKDQIRRRAFCSADDKHNESWLFWRTELYAWICGQGDLLMEEIWDMIISRSDDRAHHKVFGI